MNRVNLLQPRLPFPSDDLRKRIAEADRARCRQLLGRLMSEVIKAERHPLEVDDEREDPSDAS
jgi:hypothetical protein